MTMKADTNQRYGLFAQAFLILPAVALGAWAMIRGGASPVLWGQQLAAWLTFPVLAGLLKPTAGKVPRWAWLLVYWLLLSLTLFGKPVDGARRWFSLGFFHVNAAMLTLPALIVLLYGTERPHPVLLCVAVLLCLQPDLSQLAAFSIAALPLLWARREARIWGVVSLFGLALLMGLCLLRPATVDPVAYSEGILDRLGQISGVCQWAGILALAVVPVYWLLGFRRLHAPQMLALALYYAVIMLFSMIGAYPVPFVGFGVSPIAGYWLAWLVSK